MTPQILLNKFGTGFTGLLPKSGSCVTIITDLSSRAGYFCLSMITDIITAVIAHEQT